MALLFKPLEPRVHPMSSTTTGPDAGDIGSTKPILARRAALLLFAVVVLMWGSNWAVTKTLVQSISPLWTTAIRSAIATVALFVLLLARGDLILPRRGDVPVIVSVAR